LTKQALDLGRVEAQNQGEDKRREEERVNTHVEEIGAGIVAVGGRDASSRE
jgi:hypothetical protein